MHNPNKNKFYFLVFFFYPFLLINYMMKVIKQKRIMSVFMVDKTKMIVRFIGIYVQKSLTSLRNNIQTAVIRNTYLFGGVLLSTTKTTKVVVRTLKLLECKAFLEL